MKIINKEDNKRRRIAAVGMYDGVHAGHRFLIKFLRGEAAARGLTPSVVTFVRHPLATVRPLDAPRLLTSLEERMNLLEKEGVEDCILLTFNDKMRRQSAHEFLSGLKRKYGVEALVVGFNNRFGHDRAEGLEQYRAIGREIGMEVMDAPEYRGKGNQISSSVIREHLRHGRVDEAATALGRPYKIFGVVVNGNRLGRSIGFPTANVEASDKEILIPARGVYAAYVTTPDGIRRGAMVNIGTRPTVSNDEKSETEAVIEAHIFDYTGYIYDEEIAVEFISRLRDEKKFESVDKLRAQLEKDAAAARKHIARR